ncbi:hypothetical protein [Brevibacterium luteolum]|uniref:Uncharacterized protein n=1 Tax=Brevibacterium luteolum TaxID=199591 RepID=A0A2N6PEP5_9MICO|nr:hypothetical protein [Brevibacterium luteolum]PMB97156.1 hypothetical protein CJ198_12665 [Brevibacterium luteolum]
MPTFAQVAGGGGILLASFFGSGKRYMRIARAEAEKVNAEIQYDLTSLDQTARLEERPPRMSLQPRKPINSLLLIGGSYLGSAIVAFFLAFIVIFGINSSLISATGASSSDGPLVDHLGAGLLAFFFAIPFGLFGILIPGVPVLFFFAFRENTKRATERVAQLYYRRYWHTREEQRHLLATRPRMDGEVDRVAFARMVLDDCLIENLLGDHLYGPLPGQSKWG